MRRRFLLVHNPIAGLQGRRLVHDVVAELQRHGAEITVHDGGPETLSAALRDGAGSIDAVIAAGGDGTIRALAAAVQPYDLPLGVVPMGTGNVLSHEVGLPRTATGLADLLMHGPSRVFEGAVANGEPFFLMAGVGFDGEVIQRLDTPLKRRIGKAAYTAPVLKTLARIPLELDVEVDGTAHRAHWLVAANARRFGGAFVISPQASLDRPGLVAVLLKSGSRIALLRQLLALGAGRLHRTAGVAMIPCRSLTVRSATPVASQIDGDPFTTTPMTINTGGASVRLIVPLAYAR